MFNNNNITGANRNANIEPITATNNSTYNSTCDIIDN